MDPAKNKTKQVSKTVLEQIGENTTDLILKWVRKGGECPELKTFSESASEKLLLRATVLQREAQGRESVQAPVEEGVGGASSLEASQASQAKFTRIGNKFTRLKTQKLPKGHSESSRSHRSPCLHQRRAVLSADVSPSAVLLHTHRHLYSFCTQMLAS